MNAKPQTVIVRNSAARSNEEKVGAFLREILERGDMVRVELRQLSSSGGEPCVRDWEIVQGMTPEGLALRVCDAALEDAEAMPGHIAGYALLAYRAGDQPYKGRCAFRLRGSGRLDDQLEPTEAATQAGHLAQLMRHNEILLRVALAHTETNLRSYERDREMLLDATTKMITQRLETASLIEQLLERRAEHEATVSTARAKAEVNAKAMSMAEQYVPQLLARLGGGGAAALSPDQSGHLTAFVRSLSQEQFLKILEPLTEKQRAELVTFAQAMVPEGLAGTPPTGAPA